MKLHGSTGMIMGAAFLWGLIGLFGTRLAQVSITPHEIVGLRAVFSGFFLTLYWLIRDPSILKIHPKDLKYFAGTGLLSFLVFNYLFFTTMALTSVAVSVTLLYTCPVFVVLLSRLFFKEPLNLTKWGALFLTLTGCGLVTGLIGEPLDRVPLLGITTGLGSGLTFALYSIFSRFALRRYGSGTVTTYTFNMAAVGILFFVPPSFFAGILSKPAVLVPGLALALLCTVAPFLLYTKGMTKMETGRAALITTLEPVVAALLGFFVLGESMSFFKASGILLVVCGVLMAQRPGQSIPSYKMKT